VGAPLDTKSNLCEWCALIDAASVIAAAEGYVVFTEGSDRRVKYTLVPKSHASSLNQLPPGEKAAVLAALTRLTSRVRHLDPTVDVEIQTVPPAADRQVDHVRFGVAAKEPSQNPDELRTTG
jgi:diadenosine tetraphosphate (Ap4A) HIT family hydrolase